MFEIKNPCFIPTTEIVILENMYLVQDYANALSDKYKMLK